MYIQFFFVYSILSSFRRLSFRQKLNLILFTQIQIRMGKGMLILTLGDDANTLG